MRSEDALAVRTNLHRNNNDVDWVDTVERTASVLKKIFTRTTCRLCQVYADEQVRYEVQQENKVDASSGAATNFVSSVRNLEVELYRQFLFDENSVIVQVDSFRDETEDTEETGIMLQEAARTEASSSVEGAEEEELDVVDVDVTSEP